LRNGLIIRYIRRARVAPLHEVFACNTKSV
jgi:hypothetical protein